MFILALALWEQGFLNCEESDMDAIENNVSKIRKLEKIINDKFSHINAQFVYFKDTHLELREFGHDEGDYYNNLSYFYSLFFERSDIYSGYIYQKINLYNLHYGSLKDGVSIIHDLRTYTNHSLDVNSSHDRIIINHTESWYFKITGNRKPSSNEYEMCLRNLECIVLDILNSIDVCIDMIIEDGRLKDIEAELLNIRDSYCPDCYIEKLFDEVLASLKINLNAHKLTKKYGHEIRSRIELYSFSNQEERKTKIKLRIEEIIFSNKLEECPLGATKIMEAFSIEPGKELGELKKEAIEIACDNRYLTEEEILSKLLTKHGRTDM